MEMPMEMFPRVILLWCHVALGKMKQKDKREDTIVKYKKLI